MLVRRAASGCSIAPRQKKNVEGAYSVLATILSGAASVHDGINDKALVPEQ